MQSVSTFCTTWNVVHTSWLGPRSRPSAGSCRYLNSNTPVHTRGKKFPTASFPHRNTRCTPFSCGWAALHRRRLGPPTAGLLLRHLERPPGTFLWFRIDEFAPASPQTNPEAPDSSTIRRSKDMATPLSRLCASSSASRRRHSFHFAHFIHVPRRNPSHVP